MYLKSVENVITLGKLIGLLFLFCLPLLSILFVKTKRNDLARPVMGTIFLVNFMGGRGHTGPNLYLDLPVVHIFEIALGLMELPSAALGSNSGCGFTNLAL